MLDVYKRQDIHCGGQDLIFPHHENEIAQSECCNGAPFARYWMHNGYINVDNKKMSKSLNNFFTVRDVAEQDVYKRQVLEDTPQGVKWRLRGITSSLT